MTPVTPMRAPFYHTGTGGAEFCFFLLAILFIPAINGAARIAVRFQPEERAITPDRIPAILGSGGTPGSGARGRESLINLTQHKLPPVHHPHNLISLLDAHSLGKHPGDGYPELALNLIDLISLHLCHAIFIKLFKY